MSGVSVKYFLVSTGTELNGILKLHLFLTKSHTSLMFFFFFHQGGFILYFLRKMVLSPCLNNFNSLLVMLSHYFSIDFMKIYITSVKKNSGVQVSGKKSPLSLTKTSKKT